MYKNIEERKLEVNDIITNLTNLELTIQYEEIKELFSYFQLEIFQKHYYLTKLNVVAIPKLFLSSLFNMLIFIILLIFSLMIFISDFGNIKEYVWTILIVSVFIANTVDLIILTISALKTELKIDEFYRI